MGSRYRKQEQMRLELSAGDWLLVRKHLTAGEARDSFAKTIKAGFKFGQKPEVDTDHVGIALAVAYLLDWSITDADDKPVVIRDQSYDFVASALRNQTMESLQEIINAVEAHDAAMLAERELEKKGPDGVSGRSPTSISVA